MLQNCEHAVREMAEAGVRGLVRSRWFSSAPVPASDQPRYINGCVRGWTTLPPEALLTRLQAIEAAAGRVRGAANAARTLDLDIIDMGGRCRSAPDPILPHPRAHLRGFVLYPLRDVWPGWVHPASGESVAALIGRLGQEDTRPV